MSLAGRTRATVHGLIPVERVVGFPCLSAKQRLAPSRPGSTRAGAFPRPETAREARRPPTILPRLAATGPRRTLTASEASWPPTAEESSITVVGRVGRKGYADVPAEAGRHLRRRAAGGDRGP